MSVLEEGALGRDANILGATSAGCVLGQDQGILERSQSIEDERRNLGAEGPVARDIILQVGLP